MKAIETFELTKYYGATRGMEQVTLSVDEGEIFGFIGPNGAGKSTLIRTLLGLIKPTSGRAEIFGRDIVEGKLDNLREIGYLPAETSFYRSMRVKDLLKFSADMRGVDCREEADRLCRRLDLDPERRISKLSYGNRKKVGIVCALQHKPRLAILDEPTGGLDPFMQKEFFEILKERQREGATVFLSSHVLSEIKRYCDRAAIIREGRILLLDSVANLAHTGVKRVSVRGLTELPALDGISGVKAEQDQISFLYSKDVRELLSALGTTDITDVNISDPELDEVLMAYYTKEADV
jgi:ABC-2 type transport system ATP-binding protein